MRLQILWPLALLVLLPVILVLYMIKQKAKEQNISSLYLWREAYQNLKADTPWEKLRHNLLLYLQLLAMGLLILAMTSPYLSGKEQESSHPILILDRSASMGMEYEDGKTRLEVAKEEALRYVEGLPNEAKITVIAVDETGTVCINASENRMAVEQAIRQLFPTMLPGDVSNGMALYESLAGLYDDYELVAFTDTPVDFGKLGGTRVDVSSEVMNVSVDLVSHNEDGTVMVKVTNHSLVEDYHGDISLYLEDKLLEVMTVDISHRSSDVFYFNIDSIPVEYQKQETDGWLLTAQISGHDALEADDQAYDRLLRPSEGKVLLVTEQNSFLEQALSANEKLTVYKTDSASAAVMEPEKYELIIFDGIFPEKLPEGADAPAIFLLNAPEDTASWLKVKTREEKGGYLTFGEHGVTVYLNGLFVGYESWYVYEQPEWAEWFLADKNGGWVGFSGKKDGQRIAVLGIDLHQGEFPLQSQFPIFISGLAGELLQFAGEERELTVFPVSESGVMTSTAKAAGDGDVAGESGMGAVVPVGAENGYALRNILLMAVAVLLILITLVRYRQRLKSLEVPVFRILTLLFLILAMLDLTVTGRGTQSTTVYLLDVSDSCAGGNVATGNTASGAGSTAGNTDGSAGGGAADDATGSANGSLLMTAEEFVRAAQRLARDGERSAVVAFGGDARVEQFVSEEILFEKVETAPVQTATNLERAVQTGLALIPDGDAGRLVLLTDGGETDGDIREMVRGVTDRNVEVKVVSLSGGNLPENYISQIDLPGSVEVGEQFLITVTVESNCRTNAWITLYEGNSYGGGEKQKAVREVELTPGTNQFVFTDTRTAEGLVTYRAVLESRQDSVTVNNQYAGFTDAKAPARILILTENAETSANLEQVLAASGVRTETRQAGAAPGTVMDMCVYSAIILQDVPASKLPKDFLSGVESYVKDYGGGVIAVGGKHSFALGGYRDTVLEDILPVNMDLEQEEEIPALSMVYVIDKSGSMGSGDLGAGANGDADKLAVAKSAAAEAAANLRAVDRVGVLAFDDRYEWNLPVTQADDQDVIRNAIGAIQSGGGTSIYPALDAAATALEKEETKLKHIILLTDGQDGYGFYDGLTKRMKEAGITLSTVAVGSDADVNLLSRLAEQGEGRYYFSDNLSELPYIFAQEVYLSMGEYLVNREFVPAVTHTGELLTGVWENGLYPLLGYVAATPKSTATVYLESDTKDPILSGIQYGLGRTIAWQTDAAGEWNAYYEGKPEYAALWRNMTDWVQTELEQGTGSLSVKEQGNVSQIVWRTKDYGADTTVSAIYTDSKGKQQAVELTPAAPGVYEADLELEESETYSLFLTQRNGEEVAYGKLTGIARQYSEEYRFTDDSGLRQFMAETGGTQITRPEEVQSKLTANTLPKSLSLLFLILCVVCFMTDIVLGRFDIRLPRTLARCWKKAGGRMRKAKLVRQHREKDSDGVSTIKSDLISEEISEQNSEQNINRKNDKKSAKKADKKVVRETGDVQNSSGMLDTSVLLKKKEERRR